MPATTLGRDATRMETLAQLWRRRCAEEGGRPAMRYKQGGIWVTVSWRQFFDDARAIAMQLSDVGVRAGDVVAVLSENRPEWLVVEIAVQAIGGIVHGIDPNAVNGEVGQALGVSGTRIVFVDTFEQLAKVRACEAADFQLQRIVVFESQGLRGVANEQIVRYRDWLAVERRPARAHPDAFDERIGRGRGDTTALIALTAGTTGVRRLLPVTHAELVARVRSGGDGMRLAPGDHVLSFAPLPHVGEQVATLAALLARGALVHFPESSATVFNDLAEVAPHMVCAPPSFWNRLHDQVELLMKDAGALAQRSYARALSGGPRDWWRRTVLRRVSASVGLQRMRMALVSGDASVEAAAWYRALGVPMRNAAGLLEAAAPPMPD